MKITAIELALLRIDRVVGSELKRAADKLPKPVTVIVDYRGSLSETKKRKDGKDSVVGR